MKKLLYLLLILFNISCNTDKNVDTPVISPCANINDEVEQIQIFPTSHPLNADVSSSPVDSRSTNIVNFIMENFQGGLKADFGSGLWQGAPIGIPFVAVCNEQAKVPIVFRGNNYDGNYGSESDAGPYPIPLDAPIEGNGSGDSHVIAVDIDNNKLYELYNASATNSAWEASSGAVFDLTKEEYRPSGWTSADAAGLPIFPCLVRYDEVASGQINHAIRFTLSRSKVYAGYVHPARHLVTGSNTNASIPTPMGMRLRLKADFDVSGFSTTNQVILNAMKKYGIVLADIGSTFYFSGAPDSRWNNSDLQQLATVKPSHFEVIQMTSIVTR